MGGLNLLEFLLEFVCTINLVNNIPQSFVYITRENVSISVSGSQLYGKLTANPLGTVYRNKSLSLGTHKP